MAWGSNSFATFLILCPTSFFLGILFSLFPYDYPILWTSSPSPTGTNPFAILETHLQILHASPPLIPRILHIVIATGLLGFILKLYKPSESNLLFDGASLVLYMCGIIVYLTNIVKGLRILSTGFYSQEVVEGEMIAGATKETVEMAEGIGREDSLRVLSASNTILALVMVGVLVLQAGQWYAERKDRQDMEKVRRDRAESKGKGTGSASATRSTSSKKKV